jgi:hypothetical protein
MWCHTPLTHWMCGGYRYELLDGEKVESLCTCSCHHVGQRGIRGTSHGSNMGAGIDRYERARSVNARLVGERQPVEEPKTQSGGDPLLLLDLYVGLTAGKAADELLDALESSRTKIRVTDVYSVFTQYYFFYLHLMLRFAFVQGGDAARAPLQDSLAPTLFAQIDAYLTARRGRDHQGGSGLSEIREFFFDQLQQSEREFANLPEPFYEEMLSELAARLQEVFDRADDSEFAKLVKVPARIRGHSLERLVASAVEAERDRGARP